ncbi:hypothetical protein GCM10009869_10520 [Amnibacterium kyonggiense]
MLGIFPSPSETALCLNFAVRCQTPYAATDTELIAITDTITSRVRAMPPQIDRGRPTACRAAARVASCNGASPSRVSSWRRHAERDLIGAL